MPTSEPYYITTPIYYVNDVPHIGHAYTTLACDVLARFMRLDGRDVFFMTGTDEHGQKVEKSANASSLEPRSFCDRVSQNFRELSTLMNYSNDSFIRTTEERHLLASQAIWNKLMEAGEIYLDTYAGWYSVRDEAFYGEDELTDTPEGKIASSGAPVEWVREPSYFFRLSAWKDRLLTFYDKHPEFILPATRRNEVISFVNGGLRDLSISRTSFRWGIPVPNDPKHIMYVWLDALTNYITGVGYPNIESDEYRRYWPATLHMVGKDILRFHAVYWPAFLMAAGVDPPQRIFAHGWWTVEGQKMSKSLGNFVSPQELVSRYGVDPVRYFLMRELPFGNDGDFSHEAMVRRLNGDLANDLGNLVQRVLSLINRNCQSRLPDPGEMTSADMEMLARAKALHEKIRAAMENQEIQSSLVSVWNVIGAANRYVDAQAPWALRKSDPERMGTVLYVLAEALRYIGILLQPFIPAASNRILDQLAVGKKARAFINLGGRDAMLVPGSELPKPEGIFPRYVENDNRTAD